MSFIIVYVTHGNEVSATKLSNYLVEHKYAACANIFPIKSAYWWKNKMESDAEFVSILKTTTENWQAIQSEIEHIHPYDVPCIMKFEVEANQAYENWIRESVELKQPRN